MRTRIVALLLAVFGFGAVAQAAPPRLVVAIVVDQLRYDYLERFGAQFTEGGFRLLTGQGAFMTYAHYDYFPTVTAPGHASIFAGAPPEMHGIIGNDWFDKHTHRTVYCVEDSSVEGVGTTTAKGKMSPRNFMGSNFADEMRLRYGGKVIGMSMKDRGAILPAGKHPDAAYWFESKAGDFVSSTYYLQELPAWVAEFNARKLPGTFLGKEWTRLADASTYLFPDEQPGEANLAGEKKAVFPHKVAEDDTFENIMPTPYGNEVLAEFAKAAILGEGLGQDDRTDLLTVSFSSIDYAGHKFGPYSQEVQDMVLRLDLQLADFFKFLDQNIGLDNVVIMLTADHGVAPVPEAAAAVLGLEAAHVNAGELMLDLLGKLSDKFGPGKYFTSPKMVEGNLYYNHETLAEKHLNEGDVSSFIREWALDSGFFQAVYTRGQILEGRTPGMIGHLIRNGYNASRSGDIVLVLRPYQVPGGSSGTTHGSPYNYDTHVPVLFYGAPFKAGRYSEPFYISDIVPTLSAALHMNEPPICVGVPHPSVLK